MKESKSPLQILFPCLLWTANLGMATKTSSTRRTISTGPWHGVRTTVDPFDDDLSYLNGAMNIYMPDPEQACGTYSRSGFACQNPSSPLAGAGQGGITYTALDGTVYNFIVAGGKLYRTDAGIATFTDVTPAGSPIDATVKRVYFTSFVSQLIINDGVNSPWLVTNLSSTPVTRTAIDYDGAGTPWSAYGQPQVYGGSLFFILNQVNSVYRRTDIAWSVPGDATMGYQQTNFDYNWTLFQTGSGAIYALAATNVALYYFRDKSIGAIAGTPGPDLEQAATHDAISVNVGALQSATIAQFGDVIYFCDTIGRPYRMEQGSPPEPIWLNMRGIVDSSNSGYPAATAQVATAVIEPTHNLYLAAIWSPLAGVANAPTQLSAFDARTGTYVGQWTIAAGSSIEAMFTLNDTSGRGSLTIIGSLLQAPSSGGYVWTQNAIQGGGIPLTTEGGVFLVSEDNISLTTEDVVVSWLDNGVVPKISITTARLGYSADAVLNVDQATLITQSASPCTVSMTTPTGANVVEGTPAPQPSDDSTYRLVVGADVQGRGVQVTVSPTSVASQWIAQQVGVVAIPSGTSWDDA